MERPPVDNVFLLKPMDAHIDVTVVYYRSVARVSPKPTESGNWRDLFKPEKQSTSCFLLLFWCVVYSRCHCEESSASFKWLWVAGLSAGWGLADDERWDCWRRSLGCLLGVETTNQTNTSDILNMSWYVLIVSRSLCMWFYISIRCYL